MSGIEQKLEACTAAILTLNETMKAALAGGGLAAGAGAAKAAATKTKAQAAPTATHEQVKAALLKVKEEFDGPTAKTVIAEVVGKQVMIAEIEPQHFDAVLAAAQAKLAEKAAADEL